MGELGNLVRESAWSPVLRDADFTQLAPAFTDAWAGDEVHVLFLELCAVGEQSSPENSPFYTPLEHLLFLRRLQPSMNTFNKLITLAGAIDNKFHRLLLVQDKRALLVLAH